MRRTLPHMNPLALRKELLIAESELNRAQLMGNLAALRADVRALTDRARSCASIAASAAAVMASLTAFQRAKHGDAGAKPSWLQTILKGAGLISILWPTLRAPGRDKKDK